MKLYEVTTIKVNKGGEFGDEYQDFLGFDYDKAVEAKKQALEAYELLSTKDRAVTVVEARVYSIPDDTDITDEDAIIDAICECGGYNLF